MKLQKTIAFVIVALALTLAACGPAATQAPVATEAPAMTEAPAATEAPAMTEAPAATEAPAVSLTCAEPVKVGLITDLSGSLAIYGAHILPAFMLGMEYEAGAPGSAGEKFDFSGSARRLLVVEDADVQGLPPFAKRRRRAGRKNGAPGGTRTHDLMLRRHALYPTELRAPHTS